MENGEFRVGVAHTQIIIGYGRSPSLILNSQFSTLNSQLSILILGVTMEDNRIIFNIDVMLAKRKMSVTELSEKVGITMANISILKNGKAKALKVSTLAKLCDALDCQPGDILEFRK